MLSLVFLVRQGETVDERDNIILFPFFYAGSVRLALVLSSVTHLGAPCFALSTTTTPPPTHTYKYTHRRSLIPQQSSVW